jgi:hypothetical protein
MEIRRVDDTDRTVVGVVVPYDEISYLTPEPGGEIVNRGAFRRSLNHRADRIPLLRNHNRERTLGWSRSFTDTEAGLEGTFVVNEGAPGDELLDELRHGYLRGMSVGYRPVSHKRGDNGEKIVTEARLVEVSMVGIPAFEGAGLIAVRNAQDLDALLAPFTARPDVNLSPIPNVWH